MSRKVCIVVNSRANYGRIKTVLTAVKNHPDLELQLIVGASALLDRFGSVIDIIKKDGFEPTSVIYSIVEGENLTTMAKSTGLAIQELTSQFENLKPDVALTVADRFETMATAITASYMNIPLAHTQGGEVTGSIDESVRHAITKLAHIHFPATQKAADNIIRMGEDPSTVYVTGCPAIDICNKSSVDELSSDFFENYKGVGPGIDPFKPYIVVLQHPVTTEFGQGFFQINETLEAIRNIDMQIVWLWPNVDAGSDDISKGLRVYREKYSPKNIHFFRNFSPEDYVKLIGNCKCLVGNSSSGIREGAWLGTPNVTIGSRQFGRECGDNVIHVGYQRDEIEKAIKFQLKHGEYSSNHLYGDGHADEKIANILATATFNINKKLCY
ncbi:UDP-N-acetyl-D-glucosamine 2-epimerase, UDP-hydrolysing [Desulfocapsa sulfexigens DSM 10523]|uniref:UDP-N-acetyl-D-glucosamine 2-epimerase, UDP-hydrolysing n=1 Tax=Desulfocapsa sulfexigens (strain DSM 10523 / SB164P1) TaxID=1167006 RepID=M1PBG3_DESSD|nr:UDP-N-acetylglucosamine 2-epimerase [Desulfocapsa sulfexigens]AGF78967.1 UDP-N-acetyl-D-glucosamine 2-epimerase, UDP-hydrolysing [Desulfocapsa sulfexigens DSM 10523]